MKYILFATLLLGTHFAVITAQSRDSEFINLSAKWPDTCPVPDCSNPANRGILFPSLKLRQYYQCDPDGAGGWVSNSIECPCKSLFNFERQRCELAWEFIPHCRFDISDPGNCLR